jgi:hypothetical protein
MVWCTPPADGTALVSDRRSGKGTSADVVPRRVQHLASQRKGGGCHAEGDQGPRLYAQVHHTAAHTLEAYL